MNKRRLITTLVACAVYLSVLAPVWGEKTNAAAQPEPESEPQFTLVYYKNGSFVDLDGIERILPETSKLGSLIESKSRFDLWHKSNGVWVWTQAGVPMPTGVSEDGKLLIEPNYSNFDELMKGARAGYKIDLPKEVQEAVSSGRKIAVAINAGNGLDGVEKLNIDKLFHTGIDGAEDVSLVADADYLKIALPVKFNIRRQMKNEPTSEIITISRAASDIYRKTTNGNLVWQDPPGGPIPEFGYGRILVQIYKKGDASSPLGSRLVKYSTGNEYLYRSPPPPKEPGDQWWLSLTQTDEDDELWWVVDHLGETGRSDEDAWWLGHLRTDEQSNTVLDPQFNDDAVHMHGGNDYKGKDVTVGEDKQFKELAEFGMAFYYPLEIQFYLADADNLSVSTKNPVSSARPGETVNLNFIVASTYEDAAGVETEYTITVDGADGLTKNIKIPAGEEVEVEVPYSFKMPDDDIRVAFTVNPDGDNPDETDLTDNIVELDIYAVKPVEVTGDFTLDYNILSQIEKFNLGASVARLSLPSLRNATWTGPAVGELVVTNETPDLYHDFTVNGIKGDSVTINITTNENPISRNPAIQVKIIRDMDSFKDDPLNGDYGVNDVQNTIKPPRTGIITANGSVTRPYSYDVRESYWRLNARGNWVLRYRTVTYHDTVTAYFSEVTNKHTIVVSVYNGMRYLPLNKTFDKTMDKSGITSNGTTYEIEWEGTPISFDVVRWMCHLDANKNAYGWTEVEGKYERAFIGQSSGSLTWKTVATQAAGYSKDRGNARSGKTGQDNYSNAVFATDKDLQGIDYPIKSGYFFNPLGVYTCTVKTQQYKDSTDFTEEHEELVEETKASFRYSSELQYITASRTVTKLENVSEDNDRAVLTINNAATTKKTTKLVTTKNRTGNVDVLMTEVMEGYDASLTDYSRTEYKYQERTDKAIYLVEEETVITFSLAPPIGVRMYSHVNMPNGDYRIRVWAEPFFFTGPYEKKANLSFRNSGYFDGLVVTVRGSMYDDR